MDGTCAPALKMTFYDSEPAELTNGCDYLLIKKVVSAFESQNGNISENQRLVQHAYFSSVVIIDLN